MKMSEMIHHAFLRNQDERTNTMPSMYDIFDITSLEKKTGSGHENHPRTPKDYTYLLKNQKWIKVNV